MARSRRRAGGSGGSNGGAAGLEDLLLVGLATRALAESALHSGFRPRTVDFYGDLDQKRRVENVALGRDLARRYSALEAALAAAPLAARSVAYGADLENSPAAVARIARGRELLGNPPLVLRAVRNPAALFAALARGGMPTPLTVFPRGTARLPRAAPGDGHPPAPPRRMSSPGSPRARRWLRKPRSGGGGRGIALLEPAATAANARHIDRDEILQELVEGPTLSLTFLADGAGVRPLALSLQLEDREAFGAAPFGYVGSLSRLPSGIDECSVREGATRAATIVTRAFGLRGWNGMDFILRRGEVVPLEMNPRYTASMELWDGPSVRLFAAHVDACRGRLSGDWLPQPVEVRGKALLFARRPVVVGDSTHWLAAIPAPAAGEGDLRWPERPIADVPFPGDRIERGEPVCTLLAAGDSSDACMGRLRALATDVERDLHDA